MPRTRSSPYQPGSIDGLSSGANREVQNIYDRLNYLTQEVQRLGGVDQTTGMARAEKPQPGIITIPSPGSNGFIRVNSDGVIVSYTNPGPLPRLWRLVDINTTYSGNDANTTLKTLYTFNIELGTISSDGDVLHIVEMGGFAVNDNDKRITLALGGNTIYDQFTITHDIDEGGYRIDTYAVRLSSTTMKYNVFVIEGQSNVGWFAASEPSIAGTPAQTAIITVPNMDTSALNITVQGQSAVATANQVGHTMAIVEVAKL